MENTNAYGTCKCGSLITCAIDNAQQLITRIKCKYIHGNKTQCGKRYLRNPVRQKIAENLCNTTVMK